MRIARWTTTYNDSILEINAREYNIQVRHCMKDNLSKRAGYVIVFSTGTTQQRFRVARLLLQCADDRVRCVSRDDLRVVEHVELLRRITARVEKNRLCASRVVWEEACDVEHLVVNDDPDVVLRLVLRDLLCGELLRAS